MRRVEFLARHIKEGRVLDVGNLDKGGAFHRQLIQKFPRCSFFGLDVIDQKKLGVNFPNQKIGSVETADFPDNFFDSLYLGQVFEHTWEPKKVLDQCYRILKPGGVVILDTPNVYALSRMIRYGLTGRDVILGNPDHKLFYSRAMLEHLFESSHLKLKELLTENVFAFKGKLLPLPTFGTFKFLGECLMGAAEKRNE